MRPWMRPRREATLGILWETTAGAPHVWPKDNGQVRCPQCGGGPRRGEGVVPRKYIVVVVVV